MRKRPGPLTRFFIRFDMAVCGLVLPFSVWQAVTVDWTVIFGSLILAAGFSVCFTANRAICRAPESRSSARLRPSEFPGAVFILLSGASNRRQLRMILAARRAAAALTAGTETLERELPGKAAGWTVAPETEFVPCNTEPAARPAGEQCALHCFRCQCTWYSAVPILECPLCGSQEAQQSCQHERADEFFGFCPDCDRKPGVTFEEFSRGMELLGEAIRNGLSSGDDASAS